MIPIDFQVTCSKVKVKPLSRAQCVVSSISFDPFTWSIPNLVLGLHPCLVHISSHFEFCTKGGIYVSETFLVINLYRYHHLLGLFYEKFEIVTSVTWLSTFNHLFCFKPPFLIGLDRLCSLLISSYQWLIIRSEKWWLLVTAYLSLEKIVTINGLFVCH